MQDFLGSIRRSLVFRTSLAHDDNGPFSGIADKIGSTIRKSRIGLKRFPPQPIRWRKGELIGAGAFGRVYMGMNLDSGELIAVKQVNFITSIFPFSFTLFDFMRIVDPFSFFYVVTFFRFW